MLFIWRRSTPASAITRWVTRHWATSVSTGLLVLACAIEAAGGFVHLSLSSFWIDELYTAYFIDGSVGDVFVKALRFDSHVPFYLIVLHGWSELFGRSEAALRVFSAITAIATLPVLYWAARPLVTRWAALLLAAAVATSYFWFEMAQNARSYALALMGASLLVGGLVRAMLATQRSQMRRAAVWIAAASLGFGLVHHYVFLIAGLVVLVALLAMPDRKARLILLASFGAVTAFLGGYMALRSAYTTMPPSSAMWFANTWDDATTYKMFAKIIAGGPFNRALFAGLLLAAFAGIVQLKRPYAAHWREQPVLRVAVACLAVVVMFFAAALTLAAAGVPTITDRNLALIQPFVWLPLCALADWSAAQWRPLWRRWAMLATAVLALAASHIISLREFPLRENLRDAAHAAAAMPGCASDPIPLSVGSLVPNVYAELIAYYAPGTKFRSLVRRDLASDATVALLAERVNKVVAGSSRCHAVLLMRERNSEAVLYLANQITVRAGFARRVRVTGFSNTTPEDWRPAKETAVYLLSVD